MPSFPLNMPRAIRKTFGPLADVQERQERTDSVMQAGGEVPSITEPYIPEIIFGCIRAEDGGSGSGSGSWPSGSGHARDFPGAGFFDPEGYVAYSFDQVQDGVPWKSILVHGGISSDFNADHTDGSNWAYPLPPFPDFEVGDVVVLLRRKGKHWSIIGSARASFGSGGGAFSVTCEDGSTRTVTVSNG